VAWVASEHAVQLPLTELQFVHVFPLRKADATQAVWNTAEVQLTAN
jgi:hypothetical protein